MLVLAYRIRLMSSFSALGNEVQGNKDCTSSLRTWEINLNKQLGIELIFYSPKQPKIEMVGTGQISAEMHKH